MIKKNLKFIIAVPVLVLGSFSFLYPLFYMFINSLKTKSEYYTHPFRILIEDVQIDNYTIMISQFKIFNLFKNTFIIVIVAGILVLLFAVCASYAFAKLRFIGKKIIHIMIVSTMAVPGVVTFIPMYIMFSKVGLVNSLPSVIVAYVGFSVPSNILLMTSNFRGINNSLLESAKLDGCNYFQIIWNIIIPMAKPIIMINIIFNAIFMWNDLLLPIVFLQKREVWTVMVALTSLMNKYQGTPTLQFAGLVLAAIPLIILYTFIQKYIVKGITVGSIK